MRVATWILLVLASYPCSAQEPAAKRMLPDEAAQKAALAVVADVYRPDYEKAKTPAHKVELARKLLAEGIATKDDPVNRFVLFRVARDIAAQQGDLTTAFDAIGRIGAEFEADTLQMKVDAATLAVKALKTPKDHQACAAILVPLIDEAVAADRYELAKSLAALTLGSARESRESDRIKQLIARLKEVEEVAVEFEKVKEAKAVLDAKPTDPAANFAVGKFLCFVKGDWKRGITMLALSDNEEFRAAALMELEAQPDSLKLGDAWWKLSEGLEATAKSRVQAHAGEWYRKALPGLSGLTKARVEKLIAELPSEIQKGIIRYQFEQISGFDSFAKAQDLTLEAGIGDGSRATKDKHYGGGFAAIEFVGVKQLTLSQVEASQGFRHCDAQSFAGFFIDYHTAKGYSHRVALVVGMSDPKRSTSLPQWGVAAVPTKTVTINVKPRQTLDLQNWSPDGWDGKAIFTVAVQNTGPSTSLRVKLTSDELNLTAGKATQSDTPAIQAKKGKPQSVSFSFAAEKEIRESWTLPSDDGDWQIINGAIQLHGNKTKYFQSKFQLDGDCEILVSCWNKGWGGPSIHLFGERLELPGPGNGGPMSYKVHIVRKGGELIAKANDKQYRFQLKEAAIGKPSHLGFSYTNHNNSGIRIAALSILAEEITK